MCLPVIWLISGQLVLFAGTAAHGATRSMVAVPLCLSQALFSAGQSCGSSPVLARPARARTDHRVDAVWDRGRLEFSYDFGAPPVSSETVYKNKQVRALAVNQEVEVLVDVANPSTPSCASFTCSRCADRGACIRRRVTKNRLSARLFGEAPCFRKTSRSARAKVRSSIATS
jgi:hypothetical protein